MQLHSIKKTPIEINLGQYRGHLPSIQDYHQQYQQYSDRQLQQLSRELRSEVTDHDDLLQLLPKAYALTKEVCRRLLGLTAYDEQITAAVALHFGKLIEMQTGEGKTLTALFPAYLNALTGKGVHILTFNDYLAQRDADWSRPVFEFLGLSVAAIREGMNREQKYRAYRADITYATAKEVGFDYLRSSISYSPEDLIQRPFYFAIVDEADALMIDEARNPLVLAGNVDRTGIDAYAMARLVDQLQAGTDFEINDYSRNIYLTEEGIRRIEEKMRIDNLMADENYALLSAVNLAIHARMLLQKDVDYVVKDGQIQLVDEFTGRIVADRKWRNGLQTAVEAKEELLIRSEGRILNSISLQHFLYRYPKLSGMTATARAAAEEFDNFYGLSTVIIPPHRTDQRIDEPDRVFVSRAAKLQALVQEIKHVHQGGQPVLIGTLTVKESEELAVALQKENIPCNILNAKNDAEEARIIAGAGKLGQVTISTNMAGRGTDIVLGGGDDEEREKILALGGLYVISTNRHESFRIDRQLRGRAGRQGDIGTTRFFISMEDPLMIQYQLREALPRKYKELSGDRPVNDPGLLKFVDHIQRVMEGQTYDMRRMLLLYTDLVEKQRLIIQAERLEVLLDDNFLLERTGMSELQQPEAAFLAKLRELALSIYDKFWSDHLDRLQQLKEGIYLVRYGGQKPLREYQRKADEWFNELCGRIDEELETKALQLAKYPDKNLQTLGVKKPSSTWTYIVNDNPFGNQLAITLLDNSNLGFQADPISVFLLFFASIFQKKKKY
ncbi:MAG: accessory Sec system translocase SecA2 [Saprospiraceae bacterium]